LTFNQILSRAMHNPDEWVIRLRYVGKNGVTTERVVSPIKMVGPTSLLALCLCREEPRRFELGRCSHIELLNANDVLMPVEIRVIAQAPSISASSALAPSVKVPVVVSNAMPLTAELVAV
jgi:predicted DNA-binding transcriptional regulator YafY